MTDDLKVTLFDVPARVVSISEVTKEGDPIGYQITLKAQMAGDERSTNVYVTSMDEASRFTVGSELHITMESRL